MGLRVDKLARRVSVKLQDGTDLEGYFFVSPVSPYRSGPERVRELLSGEAKFLPMELGRGGGVVFIQKDFTRLVTLWEPEIQEDESHMKRQEIELYFISGEVVRGEIMVDLPGTHSRVSDFLNSSGGFFYLISGGKQHLVNPASVKMVRAVEEP